MRNAIRALLPPLLSRMPDIRGRGRLTLLLDRMLTDPQNPSSYLTAGVVNGYPFRFDLRPWGQKFAYYYREWEHDLIAALRGHYRGGWFIDVGSSLGLYVVCMSDAIRERGGRIASIEPVPFNRERQMANIALNDIGDLVEHANVALGSEPGRVFLTVDEQHADNNAFIATEGEIGVDVVTLDALCEERQWSPVGAIKIDVEGWEPKVIEGAKATIARHRPVVLAEFNRERMAINGFTIDDSWRFMREQGYEAHILDRGRLRRLDEPSAHENLFFIPCEDHSR